MQGQDFLCYQAYSCNPCVTMATVLISLPPGGFVHYTNQAHSVAVLNLHPSRGKLHISPTRPILAGIGLVLLGRYEVQLGQYGEALYKSYCYHHIAWADAPV